MEKIYLANGLTFVFREATNRPELSLTFKTGHINEPKLGLAAVYENIVQQISQRLLSVYGGSMTSFVTSTTEEQLEECIKNLRDWCVNTPVTEELLANAINDIAQHTRDLAPLPVRQTKLAYKHTAFSHKKVYLNMNEYIERISELTVDDVKEYIASSYQGKNMLIGFCGKRELLGKVKEMAQKYFGGLPAGERHDLNNLLYTGGSMQITGNGSTNIAMFGWNLSDCNTAETNVLMSMLSARLERSIYEAGIVASTEVKIAGYFGLRTLRITVNCQNNDDFDKCINIVCKNVYRLLNSEASERRLETSRQRAMSERLAVSNEALPRSVETAWAFLGRNINYDADKVITDIWQITAKDVRDAAHKVFGSQMTYVVYSAVPHLSYGDVINGMTHK